MYKSLDNSKLITRKGCVSCFYTFSMRGLSYDLPQKNDTPSSMPILYISAQLGLYTSAMLEASMDFALVLVLPLLLN
jgi:hypothetical protein